VDVTQVDKIIRSFQKKAMKAGDGADWREMMYTAFEQQRGIDPRAHWAAYQAAGAPEHEPEQVPDMHSELSKAGETALL
jgi:hypothetical protein